MKGKLIKTDYNWFVEYEQYEQTYPRSGRDAGGNEKFEYVNEKINYYPAQEELIKAEKNIDKVVEFTLGYKTKTDYYNSKNPHAIINWHYSEKPNWDDIRFFVKNYIIEQGLSTEYIDWGICLNILEEHFNPPYKTQINL